MRIELNGVFARMLGVWYPKDYVVAALDAAEGEAAQVTSGLCLRPSRELA